MLKRRFVLLTSLLLVAVVVLTGCAPRSGAGDAAAISADPMELVIDLPAIVVDINADGTPSIGNVPVSQVGALAGMDLSTLAVPAEWVNFMTQGNIQHLQVNNRTDGLMLLVNGEAIPSLAWDGESLVATADSLRAFGVAVPMLEKVLPLVQRLGIGVIVRFPVAAGAEAVPMYVEGDTSAAATARATQEEFIAAVGAPPRINLPVQYEADGSFSVGDLTDAEWTALTGAPWYALRLDPTVLNNLSSMGVNSLSLATDAAGIHIAINGKHLPALTWGDGQLIHLLNVADAMGLWAMVAPGMDMSSILVTVYDLLPVVQVTDFALNVQFPASGMAATR
jgi:predicted small secreted protein